MFITRSWKESYKPLWQLSHYLAHWLWNESILSNMNPALLLVMSSLYLISTFSRTINAYLDTKHMKNSAYNCRQIRRRHFGETGVTIRWHQMSDHEKDWRYLRAAANAWIQQSGTVVYNIDHSETYPSAQLLGQTIYEASKVLWNYGKYTTSLHELKAWV